ncbi:MAG: hypothetical protein P8R54_21120 [Myxococcota bacterium]|nr:hypothetical protein [Myxococcota bacterium]
MLAATLLIASAAGGTFEVTLDAARDKIVDGDLVTAAGYIRAAKSFAPTAPDILKPDELGRIWLYRGMMASMVGEAEEEVMDLWRQAFVVSPDIQWEEAVMASGPERDLFEALRQEVQGRPRVDVRVPEMSGAAVIYVDGGKRIAGDGVREGMHLGQISCPDEQGTFGIWTDFTDRKLDWLALCPGGVDTAVVVEDDDDDEFGDFGPSFGGSVADAEPFEPLPPAVAEARVAASMPLLLSAGGTALISGGLYLAALSSRGQFNELTNPELQTAADVSALRKQTNTRVYLSAGAGVIAVGLYTVAFLDVDF